MVMESIEKINMVLEWAEDHSHFDPEFVESLEIQLEERRILMEIRDFRKKVDNLKAEQRLLGEQLDNEKTKLEGLRKESKDLDRARFLIQEAALKTQETLRIYLTAISTTALQVVFPDKDLDFRVVFETKRGRTEAILEVGEGGVYADPLEGHGGGVVDVLSFALRCAFWSISRNRSTMILDEPMKFLSRDLVPNAADIINTISKDLGIQVIMVTHIEEFIDGADNVVEIIQENGESVVHQTDLT